MSNASIESRLNQAMSQLKTYGFDLNTKSCTSSENSEFVNSIFGLVGNAQKALGNNEGNGEEKAQAITSIIEGLLGMINFASNQVSKAKKDVKANSDVIDKTSNDATKKAQEIEAKIKEFVAGIGTNTANIEAAMKEIEKLGDVSLKEVQEEIQKQLDLIDEAKKDLENPEKREDALNVIKGAATAINGFVQYIENIQLSIENQNAVVEENVEQISTKITESATVISEGVADIQKYMQEGASQGVEATKITAQGSTDVPVGNGEIKLGEGINSNAISAIASGGQGVKLIMDGNQRVTAGQERIQGGAQNLQKTTTAIGKMGENVTSLADYTTSIGKIGEGVVGLLGQYDNLISPYIEATGSWDIDTIVSENTILQAQVVSFEGMNARNNRPESEKSQEQGSQSIVFDFETKKMRTAFGL